MQSRDYGSWSIINLKNELRKRNAKLSGKKAVLVERLEDYDKLFGPLITDPETVFKITMPEPQHFRDVTSNTAMPSLTAQDLTIFCQLTERENISTSKNMYDEYFLISCRIATVNNDNIVTAMVASEMRKNIMYNITIKLKSHLILEAQCECAAGMGPYAQCKHVLVVLFGIIEFHKSKSMKLKASSTSNLQTFHQPRSRHTGDPVIAKDFTLKFNDRKYKEMTTFDPRPAAESSEKYAEQFKNLIANFCAQDLCNIFIPIAQLITPADKEAVCSDHDYLKKTSEETYLENLILNKEQRLAVEEKTRCDKKLWKKERLMRIHSSNFGKICKSKNGKKALAKSLIKNIDISTAAIKHGLKYEEAILRFEEITGLNTKKCGIIVHSNYQFLASTPNRLVGDDDVLEIKCPFTAKNIKVSPENVTYLHLCEKTALLKLDEQHNYYYQIQGQLMCTGRKRVYFCIYTLSDIEIIIIDRDDDFIVAMYLQLKSFYEEYFKSALLKKKIYNKKVQSGQVQGQGDQMAVAPRTTGRTTTPRR